MVRDSGPAGSASGDPSLERRSLVKTLGVAATGTGVSLSASGAAAQSTSYHSWSQIGGNGANNGYLPNVSPPTDLDVVWSSSAVGERGPVRTPLVTADMVVELGASGQVSASARTRSASGWTREVHADSTTAAVVGDVVVVWDGGDLVGFDLADGSQRWRAVPTEVGEYGGFTVHRGTVWVFDGSTATAVDPATGEARSEDRWTVNAAAPYPAAADGIVYYPRGNGRIFAHDIETDSLETVYRAGQATPYHFTEPIVGGGRMYIGIQAFTGDYRFHAIDLATGEDLWQHDEPFEWPPTIVEDTVLFRTEAGIRFVDAESGSTDWTFSGEESWTPVSRIVATDGRAFVLVRDRSTNEVLVTEVDLDTREPTIHWRAPLTNGVMNTGIALADDAVVVTYGDKLIELGEGGVSSWLAFLFGW